MTFKEETLARLSRREFPEEDTESSYADRDLEQVIVHGAGATIDSNTDVSNVD